MLPSIKVIMESRDFIQGSAEAMNAVRDLAKDSGLTLNGEVWNPKNRPSVNQTTAKLDACTNEDEILAILEACGFDVEDINAPQRVAVDEVVIDISLEDVATIKATDGSDVTVVMCEYVGESNQAFKFKLKSGGYITHAGNKLFQLWNAGGLTEGYRMPFKPESIRPSQHLGYYNGVPNFGADERLTKLLGVNQRNQKKLRAKIAEISALKLPKSVADERISKLIDGVIEPVKLEKLSF